MNIIFILFVQKIEMGRACSQDRGRQECFQTGKPTGKRPLGRPKRRWEDTIRMDLNEMCINTMNWIDAACNRDYWRPLVNATLNLWVS